MLVPVVPPADYAKFFSAHELAILFEQKETDRKMSRFRAALREWANRDDVRLRFYYRVGHDLFHPQVTFHIEDVLALGTGSGLFRLREEFVKELGFALAPPPAERSVWLGLVDGRDRPTKSRRELRYERYLAEKYA